jgi:hypothetical protein
VPIARVFVRGDGAAAEVTRRSVIEDASGNVALADGDPDTSEAFAAYDDAFLHVVLPPGVRWGDHTMTSILDLLAQHDVGVIRAVDDDGSVMDVVRTRALRRALHQYPDEDPITVAAQLFGIWWVDVGALDITASASPTSAEIEPAEEPWWRRRQRLDLWLYDGVEALLRRAAR